jgi:hypothetical protein
MAGKIDAANIGQDKTYKDPNDAVKAATGTYEDAADALSMDEKLPVKQMPQDAGPNPFGSIRRVG